MKTFDGGAAAADAIRENFLVHQDEYPEHLRTRLEPLTKQGASGVDLLTTFVKAVYANRDAVSQEAMDIAAGAADEIDMRGYYGRLDGRAAAMASALRRDAGNDAPAGGWPAKDDDPEEDLEFKQPAPVEEEEPAEGDA